MLEDLNTVHDLTEKIKKLRAGEQPGSQEGAEPTPGQWWGRLLDMDEKNRIRTLGRILSSATEGMQCSVQMHKDDLARQGEILARMAEQNRQWNTARRLITTYVGTLRKDQEGAIERGTVADRLELFLVTGEARAEGGARRILCGHKWTEAGRTFECAEPVSSDGLHQGEHYAYVREGAAADEELRIRYLEDENDELRRRLGLPLNRRIT